MNEATINLLQSSFTSLTPRAQELMERFFERLFEQHPELRPMFPEDMTDQRKKLLASISLVMQNITRPEALRIPLQELGRRHEGFGAVGAHYPIVRDTLIAVMSEMVGEPWTPQHASAWKSALDLVSEVMLSGYEGEERRAA